MILLYSLQLTLFFIYIFILQSLFAGDTSIAATIEEQAGRPTDTAPPGSEQSSAPPQASAKGLRGYHNKPYWGKPSYSWNHGYKKPYWNDWNDWNDYYKKPYWNDWGKPYWKPSWGYRGSRGANRGNKNLWGSPPVEEPSSSSIDNGPPEGFGPPLDEEDGPEDEFDGPGGFDEDDPEGEFDLGPPPNQGGP